MFDDRNDIFVQNNYYTKPRLVNAIPPKEKKGTGGGMQTADAEFKSVP